jgi:hypothetical protein
MQHEGKKAIRINSVLWILIPPFPGSNPGAAATKSKRALRKAKSLGFVPDA